MSARAWLRIAAIWFGLGLFEAIQTVLVMRGEGMHHTWLVVFGVNVASWAPWALATPGIVRLGRRFPPLTGLHPARWAIHVGACAVVGLTFSAWVAALELFLNPYSLAVHESFGAMWLHGFASGMLSSIVLYVGVIVIDSALTSRTRLASEAAETARLGELLSRMQLDALRRQIEPHFLFNALNAVNGLIREGKQEAATQTIGELGTFLRRVLDGRMQRFGSLAEEVAFSRTYLEIQHVRFGDRLSVMIACPPELGTAQVPSLLLQPLVENAIKHGIARRAAGGAVRIVATRTDTRLTIVISNDGPPLPAQSQAIPRGIGIANVRERLQQLYGDEGKLVLRSRTDTDGVDAILTLPFLHAKLSAQSTPCAPFAR